MTFKFEPTGRGGRNVKITQTHDVDYGWDLLGRYAGLYVGRHVGDDMKLGLERPSNMLTTVPNVDAATPGMTEDLKLVDMPATNLLVVTAGSIDRDDDEAAGVDARQHGMDQAATCPRTVRPPPVAARIITTDFGCENYTFDVAVPVTKAGAGPGSAVSGPVKYVQAPAGRAVTAGYTGYWAGLDAVHNGCARGR